MKVSFPNNVEYNSIYNYVQGITSLLEFTIHLQVKNFLDDNQVFQTVVIV